MLAGSDDCYITTGSGVSTAILAVSGNRVREKTVAVGLLRPVPSSLGRVRLLTCLVARIRLHATVA